MFYAKSENKRKRWYRLLTIGQKKLVLIGVTMGLLVLVFFAVMGVYAYRAFQFDLSRVGCEHGSSMLYDTANRPIASLSSAEEKPLLWSELPEHLVNAFVAREDARFFEHGGVVMSSVLRSVLRNITSLRYEQGASTITMQLARNAFELRDKSLDRKLVEVMLAQRIEHNFDKHTIMLQYLSRIYYGQNCYGIRDAAERYFGKNVSDLNLVECATLAGLVRAPSLFNPVHSMENAMTVKEETLQRMLECEMISREECDAACAAPIILAEGKGGTASAGSYAAMWTQRELRDLQDQIGSDNGGVHVVSNLRLPLQQYLEKAAENAMLAVENPAFYPDSWLAVSGETPEDAEARKKSFMKLTRPAGLKARGQNNDMTGLLQCCVLVVDNRKREKGKVLALIGGRTAADGIDRWQTHLQPGRLAAPLVFCCACLPQNEGTHIVTKDACVTGEGLGYPVVRAFFDSLKLDWKLPGSDRAEDLYGGHFRMRKIDIARLLYDVQNLGTGYKLRLINSIWSAQRSLVYAYEPDRTPDYIDRQSARAVADLPPFRLSEGKPVMVNETLPGNSGQFSMIIRPNGVCVFVWMGFDDPSLEVAGSSLLPRILRLASMNLAKEMYEETRAELRRESELKKQQEEQEKAAAQAKS